MTSVEIVYATKTGCSRDVAEAIAAALRPLGHEAAVIAASAARDPQAPVVALVSGVRAGRWHNSIRTWLLRHDEELAGRRVVAVSVCLDVLDDEPKALAEAAKAASTTTVRPVAVIALPGRMILAEYGFLERQLMRRIARDKGLSEGDYRDQERERTTAASIAALL